MEREFVIIACDFERLTKSFRALAAALHREREFGTQVVTREDDPPSETKEMGATSPDVALSILEDPFA